MRASVVINTYNRAAGLERTLDALRYQTLDAFEVIVVNGPSTDGTEAVLHRYADAITVARCREPHLTKSRNIGIAAASGDVVAFIDDDAIPEPTWLATLMHGYESPRIGGVGGFVLDDSGRDFQWRYASCTRLGGVSGEVTPPLGDFMAPGADPFVYLQGTNCSFRHACLVEAGGFDEGLEHYYDDADISGRIIDLGYQLRIQRQARVHHKTLTNRTRNEARVIVSPFAIAADHAYFASRHGSPTYAPREIARSIERFADGLCAAADAHLGAQRLTREQHRRFMREVSEGLAAGVRRGAAPSSDLGRATTSSLPKTFRPYRRIVPEGPRLHLCLISMSAVLARSLAALGHVVHAITPADDEARIDFVDGVWVHRLASRDRPIPGLDASALTLALRHAASAYHEVRSIHEVMAVDLVAAPVAASAGLLCVLDERFPTVLALEAPTRTPPSGPTAEDPAALSALEQATLARTRFLLADSVATLSRLSSDRRAADARRFVARGQGDDERISPTALVRSTLAAYHEIVAIDRATRSVGADGRRAA